MALRLVALACFVAVASAGVIAPVSHYAAPQVHYSAPQVHYSAPQVHYAAPQVSHYAAPQVHYAAPAKVAYAAPQVHYAAPAKIAYAAPVEHYAPAEYNFEYSVHDEHTGDIKSQKEVRHGDQVQGSYSLVEADGSRRIVEYSADEHSGFNAVVHREPGHHPVAVKPVLKVAAPVYAHAAPAYAQVAHAAPAYAHVAQVAPAYHGYAAPAQSYYHH